ncbi:MAG: putative metal-binding motif-containing protein, partial [Myxococcota bacterium]
MAMKWLSVCALCALGIGCGDDAGGMDLSMDASMDGAMMDTGPVLCTTDQSCQDDVFCNGRERCRPGPGADARGCVPAEGPPCLAGQSCSEDDGRCLTDCDISGDADGDGIDSIDCGGADCDDADRNRFPGNAEVCDLEMHDEDCDPESFGYRDRDSDGFPDALCCNLAADGEPICGNDCDDLLGAVHPTEAESCDELDNDCDGLTDEGVLRRFWPDGDGDDFGNGAEPFIESCT